MACHSVTTDMPALFLAVAQATNSVIRTLSQFPCVYFATIFLLGRVTLFVGIGLVGVQGVGVSVAHFGRSSWLVTGHSPLGYRTVGWTMLWIL